MTTATTTRHGRCRMTPTARPAPGPDAAERLRAREEHRRAAITRAIKEG